jgi:O-antigen/teichoic acid export membrane protein
MASSIAKASGFVLIPLYTQKLSLTAYGDYILALTMIAILPTVITLGLTAALVRFYFDAQDIEMSRRRIGGVARWVVMIAVGLAILLEGPILRFGQPHGLWGTWELTCVLWAGVGSVCVHVVTAYLRARQRAYAAAAFQLVEFFSLASAGILLVGVAERGLRGAIEAYAFAYVLNGLAALVYISLALPGRPTWKLLREALAISLPFIPHFAANQAHAISDRWTFKGTGLDATLGGYSLASQAVLPASMVVQAWNEAESPRIGEAYRTDGVAGLRRTFHGALWRYVLAALFPVIGVIAVLPLLPLVIQTDYVPFLRWIPVLGLAVIVESVYYPTVNVLFFSGRVRIIPLVTVLSATLNVVLNMVLIPAVGLPGALIARLSAGAVRSGAMYWAAQHEIYRVRVDAS